MRRFATAERSALADLLLAAGPDEPTLCAGWRTRDLAAHLVVRERRPHTGLGQVVPALRGWAERVRATAAGAPYETLVDRFRARPWWSPVSNAALDGVANLLEFFIHHEDVRRARRDWRPRDLPAEYETQLWARIPAMRRSAGRRFGTELLVYAPGYGECGGARDPRVRLAGAPAELAIFLSGRQRAACVTVEGPPELIRRLSHR
jgi:uncharacterized protein (TIGR03085 family)